MTLKWIVIVTKIPVIPRHDNSIIYVPKNQAIKLCAQDQIDNEGMSKTYNQNLGMKENKKKVKKKKLS